MNEMNKEVLHRMCDKIKLSDTQKEGIMKKINEEVSEKKHRSFNVKRFATVMACALVLVGATIVVGAKLNFGDKVANVYNVWQDGDQNKEVVLNEEEKQIIEALSIEEGYEFEVDGGRVRIDGIMYDSTFIYLMYTAIADNGKQETAAKLLVPPAGPNSGLRFILKGKETVNFSWITSDEDLDLNAEGHQGCIVANVHPIQYINSKKINDFSLTQGDVIILTDKKYMENNSVKSVDNLERIYGTLELTKPINDLVFTFENTAGMEKLETLTEIRLSPISIVTMGDELLRKTYPEGIGYTYYERNGRVFKTGATGDPETEETRGGYAVRVVKKDGSVAEYGTVSGSKGSSTNNMDYEYYYNVYTFEKPIDLTEVDYVLVRGWGLEYKIPVNVTE